MTKSHIAELKALHLHISKFGYGEVEAREFNSIITRIEAEQGEGLRENLRKYVQELRDNEEEVKGLALAIMMDLSRMIDHHSTPDKAVEPLACLADRKGKSILVVGPFYTGKWTVTVSNDGMNGKCVAAEPTYALAESKAREYLNGLEDKGGK